MGRKSYKSGKAKFDARLLLDTIANKLSEVYTFNDIRYNPTFGDVLAARRTGSYTPKPANSIPNIEDFYTQDDWARLENLHKYTNSCSLHGILPRDAEGNLVIVLPHGILDPESAERILRHTQLIWNDEKLVVKDDESTSSQVSNY